MAVASTEKLLHDAAAGRRLTSAEAVRLYREADFHGLGRAAQSARFRKVPERRVTYLVDRNINYTNVCITDCHFCAFYRPTKDHPEAYTLTRDVIGRKVEELLEGRSETQDGFELMFGVNHLGHFELTRLLLERIRASAPARIIVLSSAGYRYASKGLDFDDLQSTRRAYKGLSIYGHSKLATLLFTPSAPATKRVSTDPREVSTIRASTFPLRCLKVAPS